MKKYLLVLFLLSTAMLNVNTQAKAATSANDDLIVLDEGSSGSSDTNDFLDFLQKSFFVNGGGFWSGAGGDEGVTQIFGFGRVGFDYSFDVFNLSQKIYVVGGYSYRQIDLGLTLEEGFASERVGRTGNDMSAPCQFANDDALDTNPEAPRRKCDFSIGVKDKGFELREAYVSLEIFPDIVLNVGRQRPTWGQFAVFSVVNSVLPIELQSKEFGVSNTNLRMPQDVAQLSVFLVENVELSAFIFYQTTLDPLLEKVLVAPEEYEIFSNDIMADTSRKNALGDGSKLINQDKLGFASRVLWRNNYFTAGLTYNQGYFSLFNTFSRLPSVEVVLPAGGSSTTDIPVAYNVIPRLILSKTTSFGAELAIPISNWTIKAELVYSQYKTDIGVRSTSVANCSFRPDPPSCRTRFTGLFDWIINDNNGQAFVDVANISAQAGFSVDYENWDFGFNVLFFTSLLSDEAKRANEFFKAAYPNDTSTLDSGSLDGIPFPTAFVFYNFGDEEQHRIGLVGGFLGITAGANLFYTGPVYLGVAALDERINWTVSADYTTSLASQLLADVEDSESDQNTSSGVSLTSEFAFSFRVGATLEF